MIFPADYRQRLLKQEKSRQYKAMLDQQIRQNSLYNQQAKSLKKSQRMKTQPINSYYSKDRINSSSRQLPHESTFLPSINNTNIIDHSYKYFPTSDQPSRKFLSQIPSRKYAIQRQNDQQVDDHLDRCLQECDQLINGISKNFINLNSHLKSNTLKRKISGGGRVQRGRNFSDFDGFREQDSKFMKQYDVLPVTNLRSSQVKGLENDVGRNQMMNYNLQKAKQKQILYISTGNEKGNLNIASRDTSFIGLQESTPKTKRKSLNDKISNNIKTTPNKRSSPIEFDTINSDQHNQFANIQLSHSMSSQKYLEIQKKRKQQVNKRIEQQIKAHQQMKKKDSKIIQHLRKAKNRGNILFKKIQVFRKQREQLQMQNTSSLLNLQKQDIQTQVQNNNRRSQNSSKNQNQLNVKLPEETAKPQIKEDKKNSRANSKLSQKN